MGVVSVEEGMVREVKTLTNGEGRAGVEHDFAEEIAVGPAVVAGQYSSLLRGPLPPSPWAASQAVIQDSSSRICQERIEPRRISGRLWERREQ